MEAVVAGLSGGGFRQSLPQSLAPEAVALLERLDLPSNAAFDDVLWALRKEQGALSDLECALLFLDEWKKQYISN